MFSFFFLYFSFRFVSFFFLSIVYLCYCFVVYAFSFSTSHILTYTRCIDTVAKSVRFVCINGNEDDLNRHTLTYSHARTLLCAMCMYVCMYGKANTRPFTQSLETDCPIANYHRLNHCNYKSHWELL